MSSKETKPVPDERGAVLVFDGDCAFCTTAADWAQRRFTHNERAHAWQLIGDDCLDVLGLSHDDVASAAWWIGRDGNRSRGHRAAGRALQAIGGTWRLLGWLALMPPTSLIAAGIYRVVVRWRYRLPGGTPACRIDGSAPKPHA